MNKRFQAICILLFVAFNLSGKEIVCDGYFITFQNDTVKCKFLVPDTNGIGGAKKAFYEIEWRIKYLDEYGNEQKLYPQNAKGYVVVINGTELTFLTRKNDLNFNPPRYNKKDSIFLRLLVDGPLKMFKTYELGDYAGSYTSSYCYQHGDRALFIIRKNFFKKDWPFYLSDYPELCEKIKNGEYADDSMGIVNEYNEWKSKQKQ